MEVSQQTCAATSLGPANNLFGVLFQTVLAAYCAVSPAEKWSTNRAQLARSEEEDIALLWLLYSKRSVLH